MSNTIKFYPENSDAEHWTLPPVPAIQEIPDWYRKMNKYLSEEKSPITMNINTNLTVKACAPFFDSLTSGYLVQLSCDVLVQQTENGPYIKWNSEEDIVWTHGKDQIQGITVPQGFSSLPFKWRNFYDIRTPSGWSVLFTHPMNRTDLPFLTFSGIVETDSFDLPIHFPFFLSNSFEGIIKRGTPIAQMLPIKRESWESEIHKSENNYLGRLKKIHAYVEKYYKLNHWKKKEYR